MTKSLKVYTENIVVNDSFFKEIKNRRVVDFSHLMESTLQVSGYHDHALRQAFPDQAYIIQPGQVWVVTQYRISFGQALLQKEQPLSISTRLTKVNRFMVDRYFELSQAGRQIMTIDAQFVALDFQERKMVPLRRDFLTDNDLVDQTISSQFYRFKADEFDQYLGAYEVNIQTDDIDENAHVNNLVYLRWCLKYLPIEENRQLSRIDVKYSKEILPGHRVMIDLKKTSIDDSPQYLFKIKNMTKNEEACQIRFCWQ
ncbi:acyl-ACP thioesterase domain-containing protein [Eremococcus coleocola]|uniref:acyl-ACP thioesterase domain-containing protein n=1 Tax=Eremococcus coleocola TaxID=88132 RepID=UPI0004127911|nr:acyl-ACP thioesterase domain-containing protein [Eremococcus coleocola]